MRGERLDSLGNHAKHYIAAAVAAIGAMALVACPAAADETRTTPLSPEAELATFQLADSRLVVELVASEPQLDSPVAISWDEHGRMYVAEMIDYPLGPKAGRVRLLEDRDRDGRYEHATVFARDLNFPNGVLAGRGGVFVTAAPDILFLRDTNADGQADERRVLLTGFAEGNQQLRVNGLTWGLDNWIYGANGRSGGAIRRPADAATAAVSIAGRDFRFRPDASAFEAVSGQSQFGQSRDDWGNRFISWNTIPIRHVLFDQHALERAPLLADEAVRNIAEPSETGHVYPISPRPQTFNQERTDYYNALCGLTIFRGDALGSEYTGSAFVGESLTNLVHRRVLSPDGPSFISRRGESGREFLAAADPWFHPVFMATGPDGALYIVDFYRRWVEHPAFVAERLRGGVDFRQGAGHGRIWKVSRRENTWPPRELPKLADVPVAQIVRHLESPNGWLRDTVQRLIVERNDSHATPLVLSIAASGHLAQAKVHALAALDGLGRLDDATLLQAMDDTEVRVRQFAIRLAAPRLAGSPKLREAVIRQADFPSSLVRFQAAMALGEIEDPAKLAALVKLAERESSDRYVPLAIEGSLGRSVGDFLTTLVRPDSDWRRKPSAAETRFLKQVARWAASLDDPAALEACLNIVAPPRQQTPAPGDLVILAGVGQALAARGQSPRAIVDGPSPAASAHRAGLAALVAFARSAALDPNQAAAGRLAAIEVVGLFDSAGGPTLLALIKPDQDQEVQSAAAAALAGADAATAKTALALWPKLTTTTRRGLAASALRSTVLAAALVTAIEEGEIAARELDASARQGLLAIREPGLAPRFQSALKLPEGSADRRAVVARFEPQLAAPGDRARGATVFQKQCSVCHQVQGVGQRIGPDLSGVGSRPKETLLVDLFDPNRQVTPDFISYTLVTRQGQVVTGLLAAETATSVTLRRAEGAQDVVLRSQIEELRSSGKSLMPEGLEQTLMPDDVADLLSFLARPDGRLLGELK